jgi:hypothetical protein
LVRFQRPVLFFALLAVAIAPLIATVACNTSTTSSSPTASAGARPSVDQQVIREWPPITDADRACTTDENCALSRRRCCRTSPFNGAQIRDADPVNKERFARDEQHFASVCSGVPCPSASAPYYACYDQEVPYCDRGLCQKRVVREGQCP